jgi:outer membrane protein OmpA-like peptidoglycan-associated protein
MNKAITFILLLALTACEAPAPAPAPVVSVPSERRVLLTINFDFDSHTIRPSSYPLLDNVAVALNDQRLRGFHFEINGHTDITGRLALGPSWIISLHVACRQT